MSSRRCPSAPGQPYRESDQYERHGSLCGVYVLCSAVWAGVGSASANAAPGSTGPVRFSRLLEEDFPQAAKVHLICDNLNTHHLGSLYEAFPAEQAHRLARRLNIIYTPRNGSWLNVAEIELSFLSRQCLEPSDRRSPRPSSGKCRPGTSRRNRDASKVTWQFTTADANATPSYPRSDRLEWPTRTTAEVVFIRLCGFLLLGAAAFGLGGGRRCRGRLGSRSWSLSCRRTCSSRRS